MAETFSWEDCVSRLDNVDLTSTAAALTKQAKSWIAEETVVSDVLESLIGQYPRLKTDKKALDIAKMTDLMTRLHGNNVQISRARVKTASPANKQIIEDDTATLDARFRALCNESFNVEVAHETSRKATESEKMIEADERYRAAAAAGAPVGPIGPRDQKMTLVSELCPREIGLDASSDEFVKHKRDCKVYCTASNVSGQISSVQSAVLQKLFDVDFWSQIVAKVEEQDHLGEEDLTLDRCLNAATAVFSAGNSLFQRRLRFKTKSFTGKTAFEFKVYTQEVKKDFRDAQMRVITEEESLALIYLCAAPEKLRSQAMLKYACPTTSQLMECVENELTLEAINMDLAEHNKARHQPTKATHRAQVASHSEQPRSRTQYRSNFSQNRSDSRTQKPYFNFSVLAKYVGCFKCAQTSHESRQCDRTDIPTCTECKTAGYPDFHMPAACVFQLKREGTIPKNEDFTTRPPSRERSHSKSATYSRDRPKSHESDRGRGRSKSRDSGRDRARSISRGSSRGNRDGHKSERGANSRDRGHSRGRERSKSAGRERYRPRSSDKYSSSRGGGGSPRGGRDQTPATRYTHNLAKFAPAGAMKSNDIKGEHSYRVMSTRFQCSGDKCKATSMKYSTMQSESAPVTADNVTFRAMSAKFIHKPDKGRAINMRDVAMPAESAPVTANHVTFRAMSAKFIYKPDNNVHQDTGDNKEGGSREVIDTDTSSHNPDTSSDSIGRTNPKVMNSRRGYKSRKKTRKSRNSNDKRWMRTKPRKKTFKKVTKKSKQNHKNKTGNKKRTGKPPQEQPSVHNNLLSKPETADEGSPDSENNETFSNTADVDNTPLENKTVFRRQRRRMKNKKKKRKRWKEDKLKLMAEVTIADKKVNSNQFFETHEMVDAPAPREKPNNIHMATEVPGGVPIIFAHRTLVAKRADDDGLFRAEITMAGTRSSERKEFVRAIIDSGCTKSLLNHNIARRFGAKIRKTSSTSVGPSGERLDLLGLSHVWVKLRGKRFKRRIEVAVTADLSEEDGVLLSAEDSISLGLITIHDADGDIAREQVDYDDNETGQLCLK